MNGVQIHALPLGCGNEGSEAFKIIKKKSKLCFWVFTKRLPPSLSRQSDDVVAGHSFAP
jgi:hypothetical protein